MLGHELDSGSIAVSSILQGVRYKHSIFNSTTLIQAFTLHQELIKAHKNSDLYFFNKFFRYFISGFYFRVLHLYVKFTGENRLEGFILIDFIASITERKL